MELLYTVLMIDKDRGLKLLGSGLGPTDVATALGCDPSFISQWLMDDSFRAQVLAMRMESLQQQTVRDRKIDALEDELLEKLQDNIKWFTKPRDMLTAFHIINAAKRRGAQTAGEISLTQNIVRINLPPVARDYYFPRMNAQGEVVQVGEQVTTTATLQSLVSSRLKERKLEATDAQEVSNGATESGNERTEGEGRKAASG